MKEIEKMTFMELHEAFLSHAVSPVEAVEKYYESIKAKNPQLNAYVTLCPERALAEAKESEKRYMDKGPVGVLDGIPFAAKDIIDTKIIRTAYGCEIYKDHYPTEDAVVVSKLSQAGMPLLGKTNTHQFAIGGTTDNKYFGAAHNPYDLRKGCGGSSGGSGSAVAADIAPCALGTDTGGSVRNPSSFCGLVGIKGTHGLVSTRGVMPLSWSLDHIGILTHTVMDNAIVYSAMVGYDAKDYFSLNKPVEDYTRFIGKALEGVKIGIPFHFITENTQAEITESLIYVSKELEKLGVSIVPVTMPEDMETYHVAHTAMIAAEAYFVHEKDIKEHPEMIDDNEMKWMLEGRMPANEYLSLQKKKFQFTQIMEEICMDIDFMMLPTNGVTAHTLGYPFTKINGQLTDFFKGSRRYNWISNFTGCPSLAMPMGYFEKMPTSLQIVGHKLEEARIYQLADVIEKIVGFEPKTIF